MRVLAAEKHIQELWERALLSDVTLQINQGDKIGLIGVNGTGKSTPLRLLAGEEAPDSGSIFCQPGHRAAYLPQNPVFAPEDTVLEHKAARRGARCAGGKLPGQGDFDKAGRDGLWRNGRAPSGGQRKRLAIGPRWYAPAKY